MTAAARPDAEHEWRPRFPTDLALTLGRLQHGRNDPIHRATPDGRVWRTVRTPDGPAAMVLTQRGDSFHAAAWGPGAQHAVDSAPKLLGGDDDPTTFNPEHPFLVEAHRRFSGLRIAATGDVFQALLGAVLEQRVEGVDAVATWIRLITQIGEPAPGPAPSGMRVFPDGRQWLALPSWEWRRVGVDSKRAATIRAAAAIEPSLQRLATRTSADVDRALRVVPGIGAWTSAEVRQRALGDADALSVGDYHLASIVGQTLLGRPLTDVQLVPFLDKWRPHRYRVARLIYASGIERLPRRGPRPTR
jgi:3-methyladenine DNA glycosylase/8-oxoguanine DNA glycosylase